MITLPPPMQLHFLEETGSTNDDARRLAEAGAPDLSVVWALRQTAGRGRMGRVWQAPDGNLFWSVLVRLPMDAPGRAVELAFVTALAIHDTVVPLLPRERAVRVKWPNDVLIDDKKVTGTLIEMGSDADGGSWAVVGIGINLAHAPALTDAVYAATSLAAEGARCDLDTLCLRLSEHFLTRVTGWRRDGLTADDLAACNARLWRMGEAITVGFNADKSAALHGINRGIGADLSLQVEQADGTVRRVYAGDVLFPAGGA